MRVPVYVGVSFEARPRLIRLKLDRVDWGFVNTAWCLGFKVRCLFFRVEARPRLIRLELNGMDRMMSSAGERQLIGSIGKSLVAS